MKQLRINNYFIVKDVKMDTKANFFKNVEDGDVLVISFDFIKPEKGKKGKSRHQPMFKIKNMRNFDSIEYTCAEMVDKLEMYVELVPLQGLYQK